MEVSKLVYTEDIILEGSNYRMELFQIFKDGQKNVMWAKVYEMDHGVWNLRDNFKAVDPNSVPPFKPEMNVAVPQAPPKTHLTLEEVAVGSWALFKLK